MTPVQMVGYPSTYGFGIKITVTGCTEYDTWLNIYDGGLSKVVDIKSVAGAVLNQKFYGDIVRGWLEQSPEGEWPHGGTKER